MRSLAPLALALACIQGAPASGTVIRVDFAKPGDGAAYAIEGSDLVWAPPGLLAETVGLSSDDLCEIEAGQEACWVDGQAVRHATGAEWCALLDEFGLRPAVCPGPDPLLLDEAELASGQHPIDQALLTIGFTQLEISEDPEVLSVGALDAVFGSADPTNPLKGFTRVEALFDTDTVVRAASVTAQDAAIGADVTGEPLAHLMVHEGGPERPPLPERPYSERSPCELGAIPYEGGVTFRIWAPHSQDVAVIDTGVVLDTLTLYDPSADVGFSSYLAIEPADAHPECWHETTGPGPRSGIWSADVPSATEAPVGPGSTYRFATTVFYSRNVWTRRDPRGREVTSSYTEGNSVVVDHDAFDWKGDVGPDGEPFAPAPRQEWVMYSIGVKNFDPDAGPSFASVRKRAAHLGRELGVNAVMFLPLHEFPDADDPTVLSGHRGNGYAVTDLYAPESTFGGAEGLKRLVRKLHKNGVSALFDIEHVINIGKDTLYWHDGFRSDERKLGAYYQVAGIPGKGGGAGVDYSVPEVRDYLLDNARMWLSDYHAQGFRFDSAEFLRWRNVLDPLEVPGGESYVLRVNELVHELGGVSFAEHYGAFPSPPIFEGGLGYDGVWAVGGAVFGFGTGSPYLVPSPIAETLIRLRRRDAGARAKVAAGIRGRGTGGTHFIQSIGNLLDRTSIANMIDCAESLGAYDREGEIALYDCTRQTEADLDLEERRLAGLAAVLGLTHPRIPWITQGEELLRIRDMDWSRANTYRGHLRLYADLIALRKGGDGLTRGLTLGTTDVYRDETVSGAHVLAFRRGDTSLGGRGEDVVVLINSSPDPQQERVGLPRAGLWKVRINTDAAAYGEVCDGGCGSGFTNVGPQQSVLSEPVAADGMAQSAEIAVGPFSAIYLSCDVVSEGVCIADLDADGVGDAEDNCTAAPNPSQYDSNADGYGNACDADYTNDGIVGGPDFAVLSAGWGYREGDPEFDPDLDCDGDGSIGDPDFACLEASFGSGPGPSGLSCAGIIPCEAP